MIESPPTQSPLFDDTQLRVLCAKTCFYDRWLFFYEITTWDSVLNGGQICWLVVKVDSGFLWMVWVSLDGMVLCEFNVDNGDRDYHDFQVQKNRLLTSFGKPQKERH